MHYRNTERNNVPQTSLCERLKESERHVHDLPTVYAIYGEQRNNVQLYTMYREQRNNVQLAVHNVWRATQ